MVIDYGTMGQLKLQIVDEQQSTEGVQQSPR